MESLVDLDRMLDERDTHTSLSNPEMHFTRKGISLDPVLPTSFDQKS